MINNPDYLDKIYNVAQVSLLLNENQSTIRYWLKRFSFLNFKRSDSGRRFFYFDDILILLQIQFCLHDRSFKIEGVQKYIKQVGLKEFKAQAKINYKYKHILESVKNNVLFNGTWQNKKNRSLQNENKNTKLQRDNNINIHRNTSVNDLNICQTNTELSEIMKEIEHLESLFKRNS